jgi:hypothetical protein
MLAAGLVEFGYRADSKNCLTFASRHSTDESFIRRRNISDEDVKRFRDTCGGGRKVETNAAGSQFHLRCNMQPQDRIVRHYRGVL